MSAGFRHTLIICLAALGCLALAGCHSSRPAAKRGSQGSTRRVERHQKPSAELLVVDVAEIRDPMAADLVSEANHWIGTPYAYGGDNRGGTDCSGLVMSLYRDVTGVKIPRTTREQVRYCTRVARNKIEPGDLVFFAAGSEVSHVGLYVGHGAMIHASSSRGVVISDIDTGYWGQRYLTGGRVDAAPASWAALNPGRAKKAGKKREGTPAGKGAGTPTPAAILRDHGELAATSLVAPVPATITAAAGAPSARPAAAREIAYTDLPGATAPARAADTQRTPVPASAATPATAASPAPSDTAATARPAAAAISEVDLLDLIITQKTDSIFASQFMD